MTLPRDASPNPPLAEPGARPAGNSVGGMSKTADAGLADAAQRSMEHGDADSKVQAAAPSPAPKPPSKPAAQPYGDNEEEDEWRHPPVPAKDESPLDSLGRSVSEVVTGPADGASGQPAKKP